MSTLATKKTAPLQHLAIIMDGNRRWARKQGLKIFTGHQKVAREMIERLADQCIKRGISYLTLWAFSTENWDRSSQEVSVIMNLLEEAFDTNSQRLHKKGIKIKVIGDLNRFPKKIQQNVKFWLEETKNNSRLTVVFALNYGGRDEILRATNQAVQAVQAGELTLPISSADFARFLDTADLPDPDLIVRTGGEQRMSGFLPWQGVYAEYYFPDVLMPDFDEEQLDLALTEYANRQRRFGK